MAESKHQNEDYQNRLNEIIDEKGVSQKELSEKSSISQGQISKYLKGKLKIDTEKLRRILIVLDYPFDKFINETGLKTEFMRNQKSINICMNLDCPGRQHINQEETDIPIKGVSFPEIAPSGHEYRFCDYCGQALINKCWYCYKPIEREASMFCSHCGTLLYMTCKNDNCGRVLKIETNIPPPPQSILTNKELDIFNSLRRKYDNNNEPELSKTEEGVINKYFKVKWADKIDLSPNHRINQLAEYDYVWIDENFEVKLSGVYYPIGLSIKSNDLKIDKDKKIEIKVQRIGIPQINFYEIPIRGRCTWCEYEDEEFEYLKYILAADNRIYFRNEDH